MESALIGLGSNLGDRAGAIAGAVERLSRVRGIEWVRLSAVRETLPVGEPGQELGGPYLNAAGELLTDLAPRDLLRALLAVEAELGRKRSVRNAPRTIDLDLLLLGDVVLDEPGIAVPHPRLLERGFVLEPLAEIAPARRHPVTGRTLEDHWEEWKSTHDRHP